LYGGFLGTEGTLDQRNINANKVVIDGRGVVDHLIQIRQDAPNVRLDGLSIINGRALNFGSFGASGAGLLVLAANAVVVNCSFENNIASGLAGAILVQGGEGATNALIQNTVFRQNQSSMGGAVGLNNALGAKIIGSTFISNIVVVTSAEPNPRGGAIWVAGRYISIENSSFQGNRAPHMGGAIDTTFARLDLKNCQFVDNHAGVAGGAVALNLSTGLVSGCHFEGNTAVADNGGGLFALSSPVDVEDTVFYNNKAKYGGGMQLDYRLPGRTDSIIRAKFLGNEASDEGGGLHTYARAIKIENTIFSCNQAPRWRGHPDPWRRRWRFQPVDVGYT
jgi:hypothetical protein